jgi:hypothetical protein
MVGAAPLPPIHNAIIEGLHPVSTVEDGHHEAQEGLWQPLWRDFGRYGTLPPRSFWESRSMGSVGGL